MMTKLRHIYDNLTTILIYKKKSYNDLKINLRQNLLYLFIRNVEQDGLRDFSCYF